MGAQAPWWIFLMKPDPFFVQKLHEIDSNLSVVWSPTMEIFCIFYKIPDGRTFKVTEVRDDDGNFMPLDDRVINKLRAWDNARHGKTADEVAQMQYDAIQAARLQRELKKKEAKKYKAKQLRSFWAKVVDKLLDNKMYSNTPMAPMIRGVMNKKMQQDAPVIAAGERKIITTL